MIMLRPTIRKHTIAAVFTAISLLAFLLHGLNLSGEISSALQPPSGSLRIDPIKTGKHKGQLGSEVWIYRIADKDGRSLLPDSFSLPEGWVRRGEAIVATSSSAPSITLPNVTLPLSVDFGRHPYSGSVKLEVGQQSHSVDLFCSSPCSTLSTKLTGRSALFYGLILGGLYTTAMALAVGFAHISSASIFRKFYDGNKSSAIFLLRLVAITTAATWLLYIFPIEIFLRPASPTILDLELQPKQMPLQAGQLNTEIWLQTITDGKGQIISWDRVDLKEGWVRRGNSLVATSAKAHPLRIPNLATPIKIEVAANAFSGWLMMKAGEQSTQHNLFCAADCQTETATLTGQKSLWRAITQFCVYGILMIGCLAFSLPFWAQRASFFPFIGILGMTTFLIATAFRPGVFTTDSYIQLWQALTETYQNWHPPIMAATWAVGLKLGWGVESLLWLFSCLYFIGASLWIVSLHRDRHIAPLFLAISPALPFIANFFGVMWKDVGFAFSMMAATGCLVGNTTRPKIHVLRWGLFVMTVLLLIYAAALRPNGLPAILPLAVLASFYVLAGQDILPARRMLLSLLGGAGILVLATGNIVLFEYKLQAQNRYPSQYFQLHDLAAIYTKTGEWHIPAAFVKSPNAGSNIVKQYEISEKIGNGNPLFYLEDSSLTFSTRSEAVKQLQENWLRAIANHPLIYLSHRLNLFLKLLRIGEETPYFQYVIPQSKIVLPSDLVHAQTAIEAEIQSSNSLYTVEFSGALNTMLQKTAGGWFFLGWPWLIGALGLALVGWKLKMGGLYWSLMSSAILYLLPYFLVGAAPDFRYLYWMVIAIFLTFILCLSRLEGWLISLLSAKRQPSAQPASLRSTKL